MLRRLLLMGLVLVSLASCSSFEDSLPPDLAVVVDEVRSEMITALPRLAECVSEATIEHAWELDDRAQYLPESGTVIVRVPATEPQLRVSIVHELAYHVDLGCELAPRRAFLKSQGFVHGTTWKDGPSWEQTPSEQFAVAVALVVTGSNDSLRPVTIDEDTDALIKKWGS
ncbi:MAG: hypothetical protein GEU79_19055 [Acidimicrobiia bacterium]|nr:hypothetical protein [Acidimicrobiia bacterium]